MRISLDLDDTLILKSVSGPADDFLPPLPRSRSTGEERLHAGTRKLLLALLTRGWEIRIYTNSWRGRSELLDWFTARLHEFKVIRIAPDDLFWVSNILAALDGASVHNNHTNTSITPSP